MTAAPESRGERHLLAALLTLTVISGLVDAVCFLGLGHVFTANMTGNVVIIGFAAAGAAGFSVPASLTSLALFLVGAICGGHLSRQDLRRSRLLSIAASVEAAFVLAAAVVALTAATVATGWARYTMIAILAFAMGIRNSVIRRLAVPDMTTTVLTGTLTGLAADSPLAGGTNQHFGRRALAVLAMLAGALVGALLFLHRGPGLPLAIAAGGAAVVAVAADFGLAGEYLNRK